MSLTFTGSSTNKITINNPMTLGSGSALTYLFWAKQRATPLGNEGWNKGIGELLVYSNVSLTYRMIIDRATTDADCRTLATILFPDTSWRFIAITYSEASGIKMFTGGQFTAVAEASSYVIQIAGAGATAAETGDVYIDNRGSATSQAAPQDVAFFAMYDSELTLAELRRHQFFQRPIKSGCKILMRLGSSGSSTQVDWSSNVKNSPITGATIVGGPLPSFVH